MKTNKLANLSSADMQIIREAEQKIEARCGEEVALVAYQTAQQKA